MSTTAVPIIRTVELSRDYSMGAVVLHALRKVNLDVYEGDFVALMGASGSGKSTLLSLLGLLDRGTAGQYILEDTEVSSLNKVELANIRGRRIGFVFQSFNLLPRLSACENVALPLAYCRGKYSVDEQYQRARTALKRVGLDRRTDHQPMELSGGERQRVAIARALVTQPAVILADEPTGNLDSSTSTEIMGLLGELHLEGKTIVMVTHDQNIARHAGRICTMKDGLLTESGREYVNS
jgi:putative ABC transport system ATP-binding protein